jgi:hypothetical protein
MSVRIAWAPSTFPNIASYNVELSTSGSGGAYSLLTNVVHNLLGADYDTESEMFFYVHVAGIVTNWYRLVAIDGLGNLSAPSAPIEPTSLTPTFVNTVKVDHNYGSPGALRYQTAGGIPVEAALVRVYTKAQFDQGETDQPLAVTMTNAQGNWVNPISLTTGITYVVQFAKEGLYGPDKTEVTI